jgi:hypothetical protein
MGAASDAQLRQHQLPQMDGDRSRDYCVAPLLSSLSSFNSVALVHKIHVFYRGSRALTGERLFKASYFSRSVSMIVKLSAHLPLHSRYACLAYAEYVHTLTLGESPTSV